jgi:ribosomal protein S18 acetylase RimI-like enzyme
MSRNSPLIPKWTIEQAIPEDAANIAALHSESFTKTYLNLMGEEHNEAIIDEATKFVSPERIQMRADLLDQALKFPDVHFYDIAMRDDGIPIGLIYGTKLDGIQEIEALYVDENYHGAGVGKALVEEFIEWADPTKPIELGVHRENERAKKFYIKMGFEALNDDRHSYYEFLPETTMIRKGENTMSKPELQSTFELSETTINELDAVTRMRKQSWIDTYENEEAGVTSDWIEAQFTDLLSEDTKEQRIEQFIKYKGSGRYNSWVVKSTEGEIIGSTTPYIDKDGHQQVGSLYVDKNWHGTGAGKQLMEKLIGWFDPAKPIELDVATYNDRAIAFYKKWGFVEVPGSENLYDDKIPEIKMIRPPVITEGEK